MPLPCNIDSRGKRVRLLNGLFLLVLGLLLAALWAAKDGSFVAWMIVAFTFLLGGFCVFEARAGWCALRAMGIKTRV